MSFISDFEDRIGSVFGSAPQGYAEPFSFKKLAKRAAKEMEHETYEIDGIDTAPALYTILVSPTDDSLMRPLYADLTAEVAAFVAARAERRNYIFVGTPLVRFMVDPSLKSGKFAVFAENVDGTTLDRLRDEERAFLGGNSSVGGAAAVLPNKNRAPHGPARQAGAPLQHVSAAAVPSIPDAPLYPESPSDPPAGFTGTDAGLAVMPMDFVEAEGSIPVVSAAESTPMPVLTNIDGAADNIPPVAAIPTASPVPSTQRRQMPSDPRRSIGHNNGRALDPQNQTPFCILIDRQSGRSYRVEAPTAIIGRERSQADVVLRDPNVSRRHAELRYDGRHWHIADLRSTNGTLVNDIDVDEIILHDGDLITVGLVNLEFREN